MLNSIYSQPLWFVIFEILTVVFLWAFLGEHLIVVCDKQHFWRLTNCFLLLAAVGTILYLTVLDRGRNQCEAVFRPFQSFIEAEEQPEMYRTMLMNVFLFVPFGLSLPECLPCHWRPSSKVLLTISCGFLLSCGMEFLQYQYCLGRTEVDDVLCNTLGAALASTASIWKKLLSQ